MESHDVIQTVFSLSAKTAIIALGVVIARFVAMRWGNKTIKRMFVKIHHPAAITVIIAGAIHGFIVWRWFGVSLSPLYISGGVALFSACTAVAMYAFRAKIGPKWVYWHRAFAVVAIAALAVHRL